MSINQIIILVQPIITLQRSNLTNHKPPNLQIKVPWSTEACSNRASRHFEHLAFHIYSVGCSLFLIKFIELWMKLLDIWKNYWRRKIVLTLHLSTACVYSHEVRLRDQKPHLHEKTFLRDHSRLPVTSKIALALRFWF